MDGLSAQSVARDRKYLYLSLSTLLQDKGLCSKFMLQLRAWSFDHKLQLLVKLWMEVYLSLQIYIYIYTHTHTHTYIHTHTHTHIYIHTHTHLNHPHHPLKFLPAYASEMKLTLKLQAT
jgi:hypothetical protein